MPTNLENSAVAIGLQKSVFIPIPNKGNTKECSNYHTVALISHASKVMLKFLQSRLQQYVNREVPGVQAGFRKVQRSNWQHLLDHRKSKRVKKKKKSTSALLTIPKPLTVWTTTHFGKFVKRWKYQTTWPACWEICMQVRKQRLELNMKQQTGSK